jgi:hypothetical protein
MERCLGVLHILAGEEVFIEVIASSYHLVGSVLGSFKQVTSNYYVVSIERRVR